MVVIQFIQMWSLVISGAVASVFSWLNPYSPPTTKVKKAYLSGFNTNNSYTSLATEIANATKKNQSIDIKTFDPLTIWLIIQIIYQVVKCYMAKKMKPKSALEMVNNPGLAPKILLRRMVLKAIRDQGRKIGSELSQAEFKTELYDQLLEFGKKGTEADLANLEYDLPEIARHFEN